MEVEMKILYIKDAPAGKSGEFAEVTDIEGNVLIHIGFALRDVDALLWNLNGTPIVDDFGSLVVIDNVEKQSKKGKKGK
ncbi:hypothetical protein [Acinetobacter baumannii]|uniref:hypothetical protein n=2 Tax=Acinetobacter calcoaceticus/baumannii complex TaxID=909768 RepID=UPI0012988D11|nr:hypothetical protein [Acinetobacter baumannii]